jgi:ferredoxin
MGNIKVTVNLNRCVGSRLCVGFLPAVFTMDENGQSQAIIHPDVPVADLVQTAEQCPQCAIKIEDNDTGEVLFPPADLEM